jgi:hypothetical protein
VLLLKLLTDPDSTGWECPLYENKDASPHFGLSCSTVNNDIIQSRFYETTLEQRGYIRTLKVKVLLEYNWEIVVRMRHSDTSERLLHYYDYVTLMHITHKNKKESKYFKRWPQNQYSPYIADRYLPISKPLKYGITHDGGLRLMFPRNQISGIQWNMYDEQYETLNLTKSDVTFLNDSMPCVLRDIRENILLRPLTILTMLALCITIKLHYDTIEASFESLDITDITSILEDNRGDVSFIDSVYTHCNNLLESTPIGFIPLVEKINAQHLGTDLYNLTELIPYATQTKFLPSLSILYNLYKFLLRQHYAHWNPFYKNTLPLIPDYTCKYTL